MDAYCEQWRWHMDVMVRQEADLCELVAGFGVDVRSLPVYALRSENLAAAEALAHNEYAISDAEFQRQRELHALPTEKHAEQHQEVNEEDEEWEERPTEEELGQEASLSALQALADADSSLQRYAAMADIDPALYPQSFASVQPMAVLKALFYGR